MTLPPVTRELKSAASSLICPETCEPTKIAASGFMIPAVEIALIIGPESTVARRYFTAEEAETASLPAPNPTMTARSRIAAAATGPCANGSRSPPYRQSPSPRRHAKVGHVDSRQLLLKVPHRSRKLRCKPRANLAPAGQDIENTRISSAIEDSGGPTDAVLGEIPQRMGGSHPAHRPVAPRYGKALRASTRPPSSPTMALSQPPHTFDPRSSSAARQVVSSVAARLATSLSRSCASRCGTAAYHGRCRAAWPHE
jgi:hypothetical protein